MMDGGVLFDLKKPMLYVHVVRKIQHTLHRKEGHDRERQKEKQ